MRTGSYVCEDISIKTKSENVNASMQEAASHILYGKIIKSMILGKFGYGYSES